MSEQGLCQHDAHFLIIRDVGHLLVVLPLGNAKILQQLCSLALGLPSVHLGKGHFQFSSTVAFLLGHFGLGVQRLTFLHVLPQGLMAHEYGVHHRELVVFKVILLQHRQTLAGLHLDRSFVRLQLAADGSEQG